MPVGFQKPKIKSRSAGPGGKGKPNPGKPNISLSVAAPKDPPPGSSKWVAAKNSGTSTSGKGGGPKWTAMGPSGRGPRGTNQDPEDFPALVSPAGSSTDLPDHEDAVADQKMDVEQGHETPADNFWSNLWCQASQDVEDKQLSILESIRIRIQQFWPFRFSNSSEEESRIRPLFKAKIFVALNIWQDYISEISIKEIAILRIVLIKFFSLFKTNFSFAVAAEWFPEIRTSSSSSSPSSSSSSSGAASSSGASTLPSAPLHPVLKTNLNASPININSFFAPPSSFEAGELATLLIGGWRIVATLKTSCNEISFSFIKFKFKFKFDVLSLLSTSLVDDFVLMGGKFQKFSSPKLSEIYIQYVSLSLFSLSLDDPEFVFRTWSTRTMHALGLWSRTASLKTTVHCWVEIFVQFSVKLIIIFQELSAKLLHFFILVR